MLSCKLLRFSNVLCGSWHSVTTSDYNCCPYRWLYAFFSWLSSKLFLFSSVFFCHSTTIFLNCRHKIRVLKLLFFCKIAFINNIIIIKKFLNLSDISTSTFSSFWFFFNSAPCFFSLLFYVDFLLQTVSSANFNAFFVLFSPIIEASTFIALSYSFYTPHLIRFDSHIFLMTA